MKRLVPMLLLVLAACQPPGPTAPAARFGLPECNTYLPGSQILADIDASHVPVVCEPHPARPGFDIGIWDGTTIHIFPDNIPAPATYVLRVAAHEYGHYLLDAHPTWGTQWEKARGLDGPGMDANAYEDFADSWAYCLYPRPLGIGYRFFAGMPTADQCGLLRQLYPSR